MGQAPAASDCNKEGRGTPFVKVGEFGPERPVIREWTTDPKKLARYTDVLICVVGATCGKINLGIDCAIGRSAAAIRPKQERLDQRYLWYFMQGKVQEMRGGSQGAAQTVISREMINKVEIPLPPLEEQRRIVAVLDEAFAAIATATANAQKNLANARELARFSLLSKTQSLSEGLRRLADVCVVDWGNTKLTKAAYVMNGPALAVSAAGCDGRIGHSEHSAGVPVLSAIGARCGRMFFPDEPFTAIKNTITLTPRSKEILGKFLFYILESVDLPKRGAAQPFIAKGDINKFQVPVPSISNQAKLVHEMDMIFAECSRLESNAHHKLACLQDLKQCFLHRAFRGELTVCDSETIAA